MINMIKRGLKVCFYNFDATIKQLDVITAHHFFRRGWNKAQGWGAEMGQAHERIA